ncbi:MAG: VOC family protein [Actinomycetota bacterium]|nr:VOC family protein [Actinomycetota bacterium]
MRLEGIHHITAITGDARANVAFYTGVLGLRLVAKTVNQDDPGVYHLFYADERGCAGSELTFFAYQGAVPGRPGAGMVHRIVWPRGSGRRPRSGSGSGGWARPGATRRGPAAGCASPTPSASSMSSWWATGATSR